MSNDWQRELERLTGTACVWLHRTTWEHCQHYHRWAEYQGQCPRGGGPRVTFVLLSLAAAELMLLAAEMLSDALFDREIPRGDGSGEMRQS